MIFTEENDICYALNMNNRTARISNSPDASGDIIIPFSIKHQSFEFIITSISESAFKNNVKIKSISFSSNSQLLLIENEAFSHSSLQYITIPSHTSQLGERVFEYCNDLITVGFSDNSELIIISKETFSNSSIQNLTIPSKVEQLKEGWCDNTTKLTNVTIEAGNKHFSYYQNSKQIIVGKSDPKSDTFDSLVFVSRDIEQITIPDSIIYINSFSFSGCLTLKSITFSEGSELQMIDKNSFSNSTVEFLSIPSKVVELKEGWCHRTPRLNKVDISPLNENFAYLDHDQKMIVGKSRTNDGCFDILIFACRDMIRVIIPAYVRRISAFAFASCKRLKTVGLSEDSELFSIGEKAFANSSLESIFIPAFVSIIEKCTFLGCENLRTVKFSINSQL